MENDLHNKVEKLYNEIGESLKHEPINDVQHGVNIALGCIHSKLAFILGHYKTYTAEELKKALEL